MKIPKWIVTGTVLALTSILLFAVGIHVGKLAWWLIIIPLSFFYSFAYDMLAKVIKGE